MTNRLQKIEEAINSMSDDKFNELLNELGVKEEKRWIPEIDEWFWVVDSLGEPECYTWINNEYDNYALLMNNVFKTEEEAEAQRDFNFEKAKLIKEIKDSSDVIDWGDGEQSKHSLFYYHCGNKIAVITSHTGETQGTTYTTNKAFLKNLIANEPERIKKYYFGIGE